MRKWLRNLMKEVVKEWLEKIENEIREKETFWKESFQGVVKSLTRLEKAIEEDRETHRQLLENLTEKEKHQKGLAVILDWENLSWAMKTSNLIFPGRKLIDEATQVFGKPEVFSMAFVEGSVSGRFREMLEISGFVVVLTRDSNKAILEWLEKQGFPNPYLDTILLFTNNKTLLFKADLVQLKFYPKKELISIRLEEKYFKDEKGRYQLRLPTLAKEEIPLQKNPFRRIVEAINKERLLQPEKDYFERFFLIVAYALSMIPTSGFQRGLGNLVSVIYDAFLYPNPTIAQSPDLYEIARDKENTRLVLEALLEGTDCLLRKRTPTYTFYEFNFDSQFFKKLRFYFPEVEEYFK